MKKTIIITAKFKKLLRRLLLVALLFPVVSNAQELEMYDYHPPGEYDDMPKSGNLYSEHGGVHTPKGSLKVLLVFAQFENDIQNEGNTTWPINSLPNYNNVLYTDINHFNDTCTDLSLSNFYYQMSRHADTAFKMYGEVFPHLIKIPQPTYDYSFSTFTTQVFDSIELNYPNYNWSAVDNRNNRGPDYDADGYYLTDNSTYYADDTIDYVIISFRWNGGDDPWGSTTDLLQHHKASYYGGNPTAVAGIYEQFVNVGSGSICAINGFTNFHGLMNEEYFRELFLHEFSHNLYSSPHYFGANNNVGDYYYLSSGWGMMQGSGYKKYCALGWEQWWLGWNNITYDLQDANDNGTYTLNDFITTGDMMRIEIPNTGQRIWLEYHTGQSVFDKRVRYLKDRIDTVIPQAPNGLIAYVENMGTDKSLPHAPNTNGLKMLNGIGNFDYSNSYSNQVYPEWWNPLYEFTQEAASLCSSPNSQNQLTRSIRSTGYACFQLTRTLRSALYC